MKRTLIAVPARVDLERILWSDSASDAWVQDALHVLKEAEDPDDRLAAIKQLIEMAGSETCDVDMSLEDEDEAADLDDLATTAKRGAILLLHAAWAAEKAAKR